MVTKLSLFLSLFSGPLLFSFGLVQTPDVNAVYSEVPLEASTLAPLFHAVVSWLPHTVSLPYTSSFHMLPSIFPIKKKKMYAGSTFYLPYTFATFQ